MSSADEPQASADPKSPAATAATQWNPRLLTDEESPQWARQILRALHEGQREQDTSSATPTAAPSTIPSAG